VETKKTISIHYSSADLVESYNRAVDLVAKERKYLSTIEGFSLESSRDFLSYVIQYNFAQYFLISGKTVIGWCDVIPKSIPEFSHVGVLGMGILPEYRGKGYGKKLMDKTIKHAFTINNLEKIELIVYESNEGAISLYRKAGFIEEGKRMQVRKIDGRYENELFMGMFRPA